jgi:hypothetical protein
MSDLPEASGGFVQSKAGDKKSSKSPSLTPELNDIEKVGFARPAKSSIL